MDLEFFFKNFTAIISANKANLLIKIEKEKNLYKI